MHQQKYPDYRYQPRRYGRNGTNNTQAGSSLNSNNSCGPSTCLRCGGRTMNPPSTPSTPFTPGLPSPAVSTVSSHSGQTLTHSYQQRQPKDGLKVPSPVNFSTHGDKRTSVRLQSREEHTPSSPDNKRRRYDGNGSHIPIRRDLSPESPYSYSPQYTPLPRPGNNYSNGMGGRSYQPGRNGQQAPHDPSLTLPPLQTMTLSQPNQNNVETMVMTIPFINKIKVLARISPPATANLTTSEYGGRGALVAVEGRDSESVESMMRYLEMLLSKSGGYEVRVFKGPTGSLAQADLKSEDRLRDATVQYFDTISAWHKISDEITSFINGCRETTASSKHPVEGFVPSSSPKLITPQSAGMPVHTDSPERSFQIPEATRPPFRIALVPRYQLTTADTHACATPIKDSYAPIDHWQWMASLWRGCIGPDITVYVRDCEKEEANKFGEGHPVENRLQDARTLVVRRPVNSELGIEEKALRRVGFEVEEFLRR